MTLVFDLGDFWIEVFEIARSTLIASEIIPTNFTLTKPGRYLSVINSVDFSGPAGSANDLFSYATNTDDTELIYGQALTEIRLTRYNTVASNRTFGARMIVLMRK